MRPGTVLAALCLTLFPLRLAAQATDTPPADKKPVAKAAADTGKYALITNKDLYYAAGFGVVTLAVGELFDGSVAQRLQDTAKLPSVLVTSTARTFNYIGVPGAFLVPTALYAVGRVGGLQGLADAGLHTLEAVLVTEGLTYVAKVGFGRQRPYYAGTDDPDDFSLGGGFRGNSFSSFPSGHASGAFALASALTAEVSSRKPSMVKFVAPPLFLGATMVGWARLQSNKHWLSDVFMGAGLGTIIGIKTVRFNHKHPHSTIDRLLLSATPTVIPRGDGSASVALAWRVASPLSRL